RLEGFGDRVVVGGLNGPAATLLCGDDDALDAVVADVAASGVFATRVDVSVAVHAPRCRPMTETLAAALDWLEPRPAAIPIISSVTGAPLDGAACDGAYWAA